MRITDYERCRTLRDVSLTLTAEEARELVDYLNRLLDKPCIPHAHLSEFKNARLERELTILVHDATQPVTDRIAVKVEEPWRLTG